MSTQKIVTSKGIRIYKFDEVEYYIKSLECEKLTELKFDDNDNAHFHNFIYNKNMIDTAFSI